MYVKINSNRALDEDLWHESAKASWQGCSPDENDKKGAVGKAVALLHVIVYVLMWYPSCPAPVVHPSLTPSTVRRRPTLFYNMSSSWLNQMYPTKSPFPHLHKNHFTRSSNGPFSTSVQPKSSKKFPVLCLWSYSVILWLLLLCKNWEVFDVKMKYSISLLI